VRLRLDGVTAGYQRRAIFENVSVRVAAHSAVGLIGPNGAGKTTLLRVAAGLIRPRLGTVVREGRVMYFGGEATLPGRCRADRWAALFGATAATRRRLSRLSRGTRQLTGLTTALTRDDWEIGLLDEPWEGLDPFGSRWLSDLIRRHRSRGAALVISSHRLHDVAEVCSDLAFLSQGGLRTAPARDIAPGASLAGAADLARAFERFMRR